MSIHEGAKATITIGGQTLDATDLTAPVDVIAHIRVDCPTTGAYFSMIWPHILKVKPRWRRLKPGIWVKWTGWYARNIETLEIFPVLWQMVDWNSYHSHYLSVLINGETQYVHFIGFNRGVSRSCCDFVNVPDIPGFELYKSEN